MPNPNDREHYWDRRSYDGLGYHQNETPEFKEVFAYLDAKKLRALEDSYPEAAQSLADSMVSDPDTFLRNLNSGQVGTGLYAFTPILTYISPEEFCSRLLSMEKDKLRTALVTFKPRYELIQHYPALAPEIPWLRKVQAILLAAAKDCEPIGRHDLENAVKWYLEEPLNNAETVFPPKTEQEPEALPIVTASPKKKRGKKKRVE